MNYENAVGEVSDFHSARHTYVSGIVASGASVKTAQELACPGTGQAFEPEPDYWTVFAHAGFMIYKVPSMPCPRQTRTAPLLSQKRHGFKQQEPMTPGPDKEFRAAKWGSNYGQQLGGETVQNVASGGESAIKMTEEVDNVASLCLVKK